MGRHRKGGGGHNGSLWVAAALVAVGTTMSGLALLRDQIALPAQPYESAMAAPSSPRPSGATRPSGSPHLSASQRPAPSKRPADSLRHETEPRRGLPIWIHIPAIDVRARVIPRGLRPDGTLDVPPPDRVHEAGWYLLGPAPGEPGPSVIAGHVDSKSGPGVFYRLRELGQGDEIRIIRDDGRPITFRVDRMEQVGKDRFPTQRVYQEVDHAVLRLITCGGTFDEDGGGYDDNVIAYASLVR